MKPVEFVIHFRLKDSNETVREAFGTKEEAEERKAHVNYAGGVASYIGQFQEQEDGNLKFLGY